MSLWASRGRTRKKRDYVAWFGDGVLQRPILGMIFREICRSLESGQREGGSLSQENAACQERQNLDPSIRKVALSSMLFLKETGSVWQRRAGRDLRKITLLPALK